MHTELGSSQIEAQRCTLSWEVVEEKLEEEARRRRGEEEEDNNSDKI